MAQKERKKKTFVTVKGRPRMLKLNVENLKNKTFTRENKTRSIGLL